MNKEWSELNKTLQKQLKKKDSYEDGVSTLGLLREDLFKTIRSFKNELGREDFDAISLVANDDRRKDNRSL